jgi:pimeloyl-ACP methyl ester carboxylesterase
MASLQARGVEIAWSERGQGAPVLLIHETATSAAIWEPLTAALSDQARVIAYDRRGWGESSAPEDYRRTTVEEQSEDAATVIEATAGGPATVAGAGVGAVIALDLLLRRAELVVASVLIEPPLLQLLPVATEALSDDRRLLEGVAGSREDLIELYLSGGLPALGPGAGRLPEAMTDEARRRPQMVLAELGLPAGWHMPLPRLAAAERESVIVTSDSTPPLLRDAAAALDGRLAGTSTRKIESGVELPHVAGADELASLVRELSP